MRVDEAMNREAQFVGINDSLNRVAQCLWDANIGCAPVVDEAGRVVGLVTDRDVCMAAYTQGRTLNQIPVRAAMAQKVIACKPSDSILNAEKLMQDNHVHRLAVIDDQNHLLGILSLSDIARASVSPGRKRGDDTSSDNVARTLAAVARPGRDSAERKSLAS
jgi:CBS domain-containing protein